METFCIVRPEHLNHHGFLFGGQLLKWVDEYAWIAASRDYAGCRLVTRAMNSIDFRKRIRPGSILRFSIACDRVGETSLTYGVSVFEDEQGGTEELLAFTTQIVFVSVDAEGAKLPIEEARHGCRG